MGQNSRSGRTVTGHVRSLGSNFLHHLRAHVFELVFQLDFFRNGNTVLGYSRCTERLVEYNVAALGTESYLHGVGEHVYACEHAATR